MARFYVGDRVRIKVGPDRGRVGKIETKTPLTWTVRFDDQPHKTTVVLAHEGCCEHVYNYDLAEHAS